MSTAVQTIAVAKRYTRGVLTRHWVVVGLTTTAALLALARPVEASELLVSNCDDHDLSGWVFTSGPEFPGAQGSMTSVTGRRGNAARLTYDLSKGGNYVGATLSGTALNPNALGVWLRTPPGTKARVRLGDASGQTLQYDVVRPLEGALDPSAWYRAVIDLRTPSTYYGGANDGVPHLPIGSVGLLAVPEMGSTGFLEFDELSVLDGAIDVSLDPALSQLIPAPIDAAELRSRLAVNVHTTGNARALDAARDAGFSTVRLDLLWKHSELTPGVYNFEEFDWFVEALAARGMRLHLILDYGNPLYPEVGAPNFRTVTIPAFAAMARAVARNYAGKQVTYEIWNEPNSTTFWPAEAGANLYAELCHAAIDAVHTGDPDALVTTGGVSGFDFAFIGELLAGGGADAANGIGVHPYRRTGGESVGHDLVLLHELMRSKQRAPIPVWNTEWGYSSTWQGNGHGSSERLRQAQLVARELLSAWAVGFPLIVYYELNDGGTDAMNPENNFGLLTADSDDKPAMVAVRTLSNTAKQRRFVGLLQTEVSSLHALQMDGPADSVLVIWSDTPEQTARLRLPGTAKATNYLGEAMPLSVSGVNAELTIEESDGPVYVTLPLSSGPGAGGSANASGGASSSGGPFTSGGAAIDAGSSSTKGFDTPDRPGCTCATLPGGAALRGGWAVVLGMALARLRRRRRTKRHG